MIVHWTKELKTIFILEEMFVEAMTVEAEANEIVANERLTIGTHSK